MNRTRLLHRAVVGGSVVTFGAAAVAALSTPENRWALALVALGLAGMVLAGQLRLRILVAGQRRQQAAAASSASGLGAALAEATGRLEEVAGRLDGLEVRGRDARTASLDAEHAALATTAALRHFETTLEDTAAELSARLERLRTLVDQAPATASEFVELRHRLSGGPELPLPQRGGGSVSGAAWASVVRLLLSADRRLNVLELGGGDSTTWLALALRSNPHGGHVHSLEDSPVRAAATRGSIASHGLGDLATVTDAPLERVGLGGRDYSWYRLPALLEASPIDVLIIGGTREETSADPYPTLPLLQGHLRPGAVVILGDGDEQEQTLRRWLIEFPTLNRLADAGDAAQLRWGGQD